MEARLGHDLGGVRVHSGPEAAASAQALGAEAYTAGNRVVFGAGQFDPASSRGARLLAHELAHVVQQAEALAAGAGRGAIAQVQRSPAPPTTTAPAVTAAPSNAPGLLQRYPALMAALPEDDLIALVSAYEAGTIAGGSLAPGESERQAKARSKQLSKGAKSSVSVALGKLLTPEARFVDVDVWDTVCGVLQSHGNAQLVGGLLRNEIMRRYLLGNGLSLEGTTVDIKLVNLVGPLAGQDLEFSIGKTTLTTTGGALSPANLAEVFTSYSLKSAVDEVSADAQKVGTAAAMIALAEKQEKDVPGLAGDTRKNFADHSLRELRVRLSGLRSARSQAERVVKGSPVPSQATGLDKRFDPLIETMTKVLAEAEQWHAAHQPEETDQEIYDETGTTAVTYGAKNWEKGNYVRGAAGYTGAFFIAMFDGVGNLVTFGYQSAEGQATRAYRRGELSYNEMEDLNDAALTRSLIMGAVTVALIFATAGLGAAAAGGMGLAEGTLGYSVVSGAVGGGSFNLASMTTQTLITSSTSFENPTAQSIWGQGAYTPGQIATGTVMGAGLGGTFGGLSYAARAPGTGLARLPGGGGGAPPMGEFQVGDFTITVDATPGQAPVAVGTHATDATLVFYARESGAGIYRVLPDGTHVPLQTVGKGGISLSNVGRQAAQLGTGAAGETTAGEGAIVLSSPGGTTGGPLVVPGEGGAPAMLPGGTPGAVSPALGGTLGSVPSSALLPGGVLVAPGGAAPGLGGATGGPIVPYMSGTDVISSYLQGLPAGGATSPEAIQGLMQGYNLTLPAAPPPSFGLLGPGPEPFGLLGPGPAPFGILPSGPQPLMLGPGNQTTLTLSQVRRLGHPQRWAAAEQYGLELYGGQPQVHTPVPLNPQGAFPVTTPGGRFTDVAAPGGGGRTLGVEVKVPGRWRTVQGAPQAQTVPLGDKIQEQI